jgi:hypothetical protein
MRAMVDSKDRECQLLCEKVAEAEEAVENASKVVGRLAAAEKELAETKALLK